MNSIQRIFKNILSLGISSILPRLATFFLVIYIARFLGEENFGKYSTAIYFTLLVALLADLGISKLTVRELAQKSNEIGELFHSLLFLKLLYVSVAYFIMVIGCHLLAYSKDICDLIYIFGAAACTFSISKLFHSAFEAFEKMEYEALVTTTQAILKFGLGFLVLVFDYGLKALAISFVIARILELLFIISLFYSKLLKFRFSWFKLNINLLREMLQKALPFSILIVVTEIYFKVDMIMLSKMKPLVEVGWYSSVYNLIQGLILIPAVVLGSLFPFMSRVSEISLDDLKSIYKRSFKYLFYLGVLIAIIFSIFAKDIVNLFYGNNFLNAAVVLQILVWFIPLAFTDTIISNIFISLNKINFQIMFIAIGVIVNMSLNFYFIPKWGYLGAGLTTLISAILNFSLYFSYACKNFYKLRLMSYLSRAAIAMITILILNFILINLKINFLILSVLFIFIYFLMLWLLRVFDAQDREILWKLIPNRLRFVLSK